jgi:hypothetical protein
MNSAASVHRDLLPQFPSAAVGWQFFFRRIARRKKKEQGMETPALYGRLVQQPMEPN